MVSISLSTKFGQTGIVVEKNVRVKRFRSELSNFFFDRTIDLSRSGIFQHRPPQLWHRSDVQRHRNRPPRLQGLVHQLGRHVGVIRRLRRDLLRQHRLEVQLAAQRHQLLRPHVALLVVVRRLHSQVSSATVIVTRVRNTYR